MDRVESDGVVPEGSPTGRLNIRGPEFQDFNWGRKGGPILETKTEPPPEELIPEESRSIVFTMSEEARLSLLGIINDLRNSHPFHTAIVLIDQVGEINKLEADLARVTAERDDAIAEVGKWLERAMNEEAETLRMKAERDAERVLMDELAGAAGTYQDRVDAWMDACFGASIKADRLERCDRFIEEALELVQTEQAFTADRAHALVDYVFGRDVGDPRQEVGGVMVTLAALCNTFGIGVEEAAETELSRVWTKVEAIRAKQASKPTGSALPVSPTPAALDDPRVRKLVEALQRIGRCTFVDAFNREGPSYEATIANAALRDMEGV